VIAQFFLGLLGLVACEHASAPRTIEPPVGTTIAERGPKCTAVRYAWQAKSPNATVHTFEACIDSETLDAVNQRFGLAETDLRFEYSTRDELAQMVEQRNRTIQGKGFELRLSETGTEVSAHIDYPSLVAQPATVPLAARLRLLLPSTASEREVVELFADFVQSFELEALPPDSSASNNPKVVGGVRHPLHTLAIGSGDCDSLAVLFASLVHAETRADIAFFTLVIDGTAHLVPAVAIDPATNDVVSQINDQTFVVFDMTSRDPNQRTSPNVRASLTNQQAIVIPIRQTP